MGCRMAYARHSGVRFSHQQHLHCPCLPPKNPPSGLKLTKISLPVRTSLVVRTYILTPALSPTNSAFRCTWQQVLFSPPSAPHPAYAGCGRPGPHTSWDRSTSMSQPFHPPIIESSESLASGHTPVTAVRRRQRLPVTQNQDQPWVDSESRQ